MTAEMGGKTFEYENTGEFFQGLLGKGGFVDSFPEGGVLTLTAPNGESEKFNIDGTSGEGARASEFNYKHGVI